MSQYFTTSAFATQAALRLSSQLTCSCICNLPNSPSKTISEDGSPNWLQIISENLFQWN